jgi:hypothetical protein
MKRGNSGQRVLTSRASRATTIPMSCTSRFMRVDRATLSPDCRKPGGGDEQGRSLADPESASPIRWSRGAASARQDPRTPRPIRSYAPASPAAADAWRHPSGRVYLAHLGAAYPTGVGFPGPPPAHAVNEALVISSAVKGIRAGEPIRRDR